MINFREAANIRVKQYLLRNSSNKDKRAIKAFFAVLKAEGLTKARMTALVKGSKSIAYLIESLSSDYCRAYPYSGRDFVA